MMGKALRVGFCGVLIISCLLGPACLVSSEATDSRSMERTYKNATLVKRANDTLVFAIDRDGRMATLHGLLDTRTRMKDVKGRIKQKVPLEPESVWTIRVRYPRYGEGVPVIVDMRMVRGVSPQ